MPRHTIVVTQADIDNGERGDNLQCPIALAMRRHWPDPGVGLELFWPDPDSHPCDLPDRAKRWIERFDTGKGVPVKPFRFTVEV